MQITNLHPNVRLLRYHGMLRELNFVIPVVVMFVQMRGVSFAEFMAIQGMFSVVMVLADPLISPLADRFGRKPAILVGSVLWTLGHAIMWQGYGWQTFAVAEMILGIGMAAFRPAAEALLYDSLASVDRKDAHYAALTQQNRAISYASALAMACGGWMFVVNPDLPILACVVLNAGLLLVGWRFAEAPYHTSIAAKAPTYRKMWRQVWQSLSAPQTRWLVIMPGLISGSTITLFWSVQPTFTAAGVGAGMVSILLAGYFALRGWFAGWCPNLVTRYTGRQCFAMCVVALAGGYLSLALLPWWAAYPMFVVGSGFTYMLADTMGRELLHRHVASEVRSTAIGGYQLAGRVISTSTLGVCSLLLPVAGLPVTLLVIGGVMVTLATLSLLRLPQENISDAVSEAA